MLLLILLCYSHSSKQVRAYRNEWEKERSMVGDIFLGFIIICMAILVGYPLLKLILSSLRPKQRERRKAQSHTA
jgi:hypothetical protein